LDHWQGYRGMKPVKCWFRKVAQEESDLSPIKTELFIVHG
jgi:hypothetical protein